MKIKHIAIVFGMILITSCDFNVNDSPGSKLSSSIEEAKSHGTYICAYRINNDTIQGVKIEPIFAERKYEREKGLLLNKKIDCCKAQLIFISKNAPFSTQNSGYDVDWKVIGFETPSPDASIIYKDYGSIMLPDTIPITIIALKGKDSSKTIAKRILYKIKEDK